SRIYRSGSRCVMVPKDRSAFLQHALGVNDALAYKTDEATELGEYGDRTSLYTSPASSTKVVRRTPRYAAPT
ncbi:hypothetical protein, partial [Streptomyces rimosus]